jgi:hypothetical protein
MKIVCISSHNLEFKSLSNFTTKAGIVYLEMSVFVTFILNVSNVVIIVRVKMFMAAR